MNDTDHFTFPEGAVLVKNLMLDTIENQPATRVYIETQLLIYQSGEWLGMTYKWRRDQSDADLVGGSAGGWTEDSLMVRKADGTLGKKKWLFAARWANDFNSHGRGMVSCKSCHGNIGPDYLGGI